jgi:trk system potassium uptake protein TrkA
MKVVVIGSSDLGKLVADSLLSCTIVEESLDRARELAKAYGLDRMVVGDPTDEATLLKAGVEGVDAVLVATGDDSRNLTVAKLLERLSQARIMLEAEDPSNVQVFSGLGFEDVFCPHLSAAQQVLFLLQPEDHQVSEVCVTDKSPLKGRRMRDLALPKGVIVAGVLRGESLMRPDPELIFQRGDHIVVHSSSGPALIDALLSDWREEMRPFTDLTVLLDETRESELMAREVTWLARTLGARLRLVSHSDKAIIKAKDVATAWHVVTASALQRTETFADLLTTAPLLGEGNECLVIPMHPGISEGFLRRKRFIDSFASLPMPVLISRGTWPYRRILALVDVPGGERSASELATRMAIMGNIELGLLWASGSSEAGEETVQLKRMARTYGVQVRDDAIEGNPTVELVSLIRSGRFDLVALDWGCKLLKQDIMRRIVFESPVSVMIRGKGVCDLPAPSMEQRLNAPRR